MTLSISLSKDAFEVVDESGNRLVDSHSFTLYAGFHQPDAISEALSGSSCIKVEIK
jgi:beta-glucosidase